MVFNKFSEIVMNLVNLHKKIFEEPMLVSFEFHLCTSSMQF